jgi:hypothetical protein
VKAALVSNSGEIAGNDQHIETPLLKDGVAEQNKVEGLSPRSDGC